LQDLATFSLSLSLSPSILQLISLTRVPIEREREMTDFLCKKTMTWTTTRKSSSGSR
jgi:hypothetical protein